MKKGASCSDVLSSLYDVLGYYCEAGSSTFDVGGSVFEAWWVII